MDPQASALDWAWEAKDFDVVGQERIKPADLRRMRNQYHVVLIDCPPQYAEPSAAAIRIADLVLVPVQPSQLDVWATQAIVDLIKVRQAVIPLGSPKAVFVMSTRRPPYQALGAASRDAGPAVLSHARQLHHAAGGLRRGHAVGRDRVRRQAHTGRLEIEAHPRRNPGDDQCPLT